MLTFKPRILVSFAYFRTVWPLLSQVDNDKYDLVIDCGAYSAKYSTREVALEAYIKFLRELPRPVTWYASMDVIRDPDATHENYLRMKDAGLSPVPVFTRGTDPKRAEEYWAESELLCLGGFALKQGAKRGAALGYVKWFMEDVAAGRKVHWFGMVDLDFAAAYHPDSMDTASHVSALRYGKVYVRDQQTMHATLVTRADYLDGNVKAERIRKYCMSIGRPEWYYDLKQDSNWRERVRTASTAGLISQLSYLTGARNAEKRIGSKVYAALASTSSCWSFLELVNGEEVYA